MRSFAAVVSLAGYLFLGVLSSSVIHLSPENLFDYLHHDTWSFILYMEPGSESSESLLKDFEQAADRMNTVVVDKRKFSFAKLDCQKDSEFCQSQRVNYLPTLLMHKNSGFREYKGDREGWVNEFVDFATKQLRPPLSYLGKGELDAFRISDDVVVVAFLGSFDENSSDFDTFYHVAQELCGHYTFGATLDIAAGKPYGVTSYPAVVIFKKQGEVTKTYTPSELELRDLDRFVRTHSLPLVDDFSSFFNQELHLLTGLPTAYIFLQTKERSKEVKEFIEAVEIGVALEFRGKITIGTINVDKHNYLINQFGLKDSKFPRVGITDVSGNFILNEDTTTENMIKFLQDFLDKKLSRHIMKTAPIPWDGKGVREIVYDEYEEVVFDKNRHTLVLFTSKTLPTAEKLDGVFEEISNLYKDYQDVFTVVKFDIDENEIPESHKLRIHMPPMVRLFTKGDNEPKQFSAFAAGQVDRDLLVKELKEITGIDIDPAPFTGVKQEKPHEEL